MSDQEFAIDHTKQVTEGLAFYRAAAEQGNGHSMESWHYEDSRTGYAISSHCSTCGVMVKIVIGNAFDLATFPSSAHVAAPTALTNTCLDREGGLAEGYVAPE